MPTPDIRAYLEIRTASPGNFSPNGDKLLISSNLTGISQLYRTPADGGELLQLTDEPEPVGGGYLPSSDDLLLAMDVGGNERHQLYLMDDAGGARRDLVVDPDHIHHPGGVTRDGTRLAYATNRRNGVDFDVWIRELSGGNDEEMVFGPGGWCSAGGFSPDGRWLAVSRLTTRSGDNEVHIVDTSSGEAFELSPHDDASAVGTPTWLPDSSAFFFSHSVGTEFTTVARFDLATRATTAVFDGEWDAGAGIDWTGEHLLVTRNVDGYTQATLHDPTTLALRQPLVLPGRGIAGGFAFSHDGRRLAYVFSSALVPGDTWVTDLDTGAAQRVTTSPCDVDPSTFVEPELVHIPSFDDEQIPAFVFRPRTHTGRCPVVVMIHGGPEGQYRPGFAPLTQYLVGQGFAIVAPNVRGSTGYGKRYEHLDDIALRGDSIKDLAAIHDWLATTDDLDPDRAALYGGSYGGYMVLAGLAFQPERWAAGVDIVGISSLVTFLQNTAEWRRAFREREYGSLVHDRELLESLSPINHVDAIAAPLFVIHGRNDPRVPVGEAEQIHAILSGKGQRCDLRIYEDEGHGLGKLANRIDAYPQVAEFLSEVLAPKRSR